MKIGDAVYVNRQIGKNGIPKKTKGIIESFSKIIIVNGKETAKVKFQDNDSYYYPIDEITPAVGDLV